MLGMVIHLPPEPLSSAEIALLFHQTAIHENHKPALEEAQTIVFNPQKTFEYLFLPLTPRGGQQKKKNLASHTKTSKEPRQCIACLVDTQESLKRLASVCEKPPEFLTAP